MNEPDAPQSASAEEEARIAETPAVFANKVFVSPQPGGAKITLPKPAGRPARTWRRRAWRCSCSTQISAALRRLLDWSAGGADMPSERFGGSMH